jgi:hypothetical protein
MVPVCRAARPLSGFALLLISHMIGFGVSWMPWIVFVSWLVCIVVVAVLHRAKPKTRARPRSFSTYKNKLSCVKP